MISVHGWGGPSKRWIKGSKGWHEETKQSEIIAESIQINQVKKIIEAFLRHRQQKKAKQLYSNLSAAPISKCSVKESVMWLQVSSSGSKECHGYSTLGELLRRLHLTGSVWQQGRFHYIISLTELIVLKKLNNLSGTSRKHLFVLIETLINRVMETRERIRQMKRIVQSLMASLMKKNYRVSSKVMWYAEVDVVRKWCSKMNQIGIVPRVDNRLSIPSLPVCVQRHIISMLDNHEDIESVSMVNKTLYALCDEPDLWKNMCLCQFTANQVKECDEFLERRQQRYAQHGRVHDEVTWRRKYHFMLKRYETDEKYADPLLLCVRCRIVFWKDSGHPCIGSAGETDYEPIHPKKLVSFFE